MGNLQKYHWGRTEVAVGQAGKELPLGGFPTGIYQVYVKGGDHMLPQKLVILCLTVSNANGENTFCKTFNLGVSAVSEGVERKDLIRVYPNPASDWFVIEQREDLILSGEFRLFNLLGEEMLHLKMDGRSNPHKIEIGELPNSGYYWNMVSEGKVLHSGKVVKMK